MGVIKIFVMVAGPVAAMTYAAFSLGRELPKASRRMGNYIGLGYVYFKSTLKILKPEDQMPYEMIDIVRKASQQSQALRRELRNTIKKAKEDFRIRNQEAMAKVDSRILENEPPSEDASPQTPTQHKFKPGGTESGADLMSDLDLIKVEILAKKKAKAHSRRFYEEL